MEQELAVLFIILATVVFTSLGGLFALRYQDKLHLVLGFSAGTILGVALFDLLPESLELTKNIYNVQTLMLMVVCGFSGFLLIDRMFSIHKHDDDCCNKPTHRGKLSVLVIILHSMLDGFGIGLAFKVSPSIGLVVSAAVLIHDFSDGINTVSIVLKGKEKRTNAIYWLIADALAPAAGIILAYTIVLPGSVLGLILAVFVGLFLYISTHDLIPESHHGHPTVLTTLSTIFGLVLIYILNLIA